MDSIPGQGTKIPYAVGQLNPCATTRELSAAPKINKTKTIYHVRFNSRSKSDIFNKHFGTPGKKIGLC